MDEFAQTRGADDLFEDDFTPLEDPPTQHQYPDTLQPSPPHQPPPTSQPPPHDNSPNESHNTAPPQPPHSPSTSPSTTAPEHPLADPTPFTQPPAPTTPHPDTTLQSVRGPRHLSGGPTVIRLTEAELSAKLAAARLNSSRRAEAHARAEADEASFLQREARAGERRKEEGRNRRVMDQERERNRLRKLEVGRRGGREWDEGKVEEERGGRGGFRGVNGGVGGRRGRGGQLFGDGGLGEGEGEGGGGYGFDGGRGFDEGRGGRGRGRGRGGRGGGGGGGEGGGRGRGGFLSGQRVEQRVPDPQMDFPALPSASKVDGQQQALPPDTVKESIEAKTERPSWDDQVAESSGGW